MSESTVRWDDALALLPFPENLQCQSSWKRIDEGDDKPAECDLQRVEFLLQVVMSVVTLHNIGTGPLPPSSVKKERVDLDVVLLF